METKLFEVRDKGTLLVMLAVLLQPENDEEHWLLRRTGYSCDAKDTLVNVTSLNSHDPFDWGDRTRHTAHRHITENWYDLRTGDVIDVEFILGESTAPKCSEKETQPL